MIFRGAIYLVNRGANSLSFSRCRLTECPDAPEVKFLDKSGYTFRDLSFIVTDSMEVRASR